MAIQNISKYVQINDYLLLEYEFNRDGEKLNISDLGATVATTNLGTKQYFNNNKTESLGVTNNILELVSIPTDENRSSWFTNYNDTSTYYPYFENYDDSIAISTSSYEHDTVKVHIVSGYNFEDVAGFLLQVRAEDTSTNLVDLSNFSYFKQPDALGSSNVIKFASNTLHQGNRFYDKYVEIKIPSVYALGIDTTSTLNDELNIKTLSDVYLTYSTIPTVISDLSGNTTFTLGNNVDFQLPVTSIADNFNIFIAESTAGDFIEYYATWNDQIIGQTMGDIESGRLPLYTSNNPNDNYEEFSEIYGDAAAKWVLIHEIYVYENIPSPGGGSSLLTQKFAFTQENGFSSPNYFRPVLKNADIDSSYTIQYICRLTNRMDGTQIIRRSSFASTDPKKYGLKFTRINVENLLPYKVFNKLENEATNSLQVNSNIKTKFVKVFYDTSNILFNENNETFPQGTGPLFLKNGDSVYKFKFEKYNTISNQVENVDLSGVYNYGLLFILDDGTTIEVVPTYSTNMNNSIGEIEFKLSKDQIFKLLNQKNNNYSIIVKNPNGSSYTFYEGVYYKYSDYDSVIANYSELTTVSDLNKQITELTTSNKALTDEIAILKTN